MMTPPHQQTFTDGCSDVGTPEGFNLFSFDISLFGGRSSWSKLALIPFTVKDNVELPIYPPLPP